jgi:hypothetical protein
MFEEYTGIDLNLIFFFSNYSIFSTFASKIIFIIIRYKYKTVTTLTVDNY